MAAEVCVLLRGTRNFLCINSDILDSMRELLHDPRPILLDMTALMQLWRHFVTLGSSFKYQVIISDRELEPQFFKLGVRKPDPMMATTFRYGGGEGALQYHTSAHK